MLLSLLEKGFETNTKYRIHTKNVRKKNLQTEQPMLEDYGNAIEQLAFAFIVEQESKVPHKESILFEAQKKRLYGQFRIPLSTVQNTTAAAMLPIMANIYFDRLLDFQPSVVQDFDWITFQKDVATTFENAGLLAGEGVN